MAYRIYVTDSLKLQGEQKYYTKRYIEIIRPQKEEIVDERTADDIAESIIKCMGLKVGGNNEPV